MKSCVVLRLGLAVLGLSLPPATAVVHATDPVPGSAAIAPAPVFESAPAGPPLAGPELDRRTAEVASLMRCPVCQGLSVEDSPAPAAVNLKAEVRRRLAAGYSADQVLASFEHSYGEFIRLEPKAEGFNWLVWLLPAAALAAGIWVIFERLRPLAADSAADSDARPAPPERESE
ncbi:MAG: cytochrome c-type biogenesis protein CcmH [Thermoanaerobaculia bacterium]